MQPKRYSSNVSNFSYHRTTTLPFPKTNENTILGKLLRKAKAHSRRMAKKMPKGNLVLINNH